MVAIVENTDEFATHSMRIGGATALFAAGANEMVIRTLWEDGRPTRSVFM